MMDEDFSYFRVIKSLMVPILIFVFLALFVGMFIISGEEEPAGSVVIVETPVIEPTPEPSSTPEPTPTESETDMLVRTRGYYMRDWHSWFRANVSGYLDLNTHVTVYGYRMLNTQHWYSVSWARYMKDTPEKGYKFLYIFVNMYSDGDDVRQYGFKDRMFVVEANGVIYEHDEIEPTWRIKELEEVWDYAHVEGVKPYGYKIIQEKVTGIIRADEQEVIYAGRSNAWDGYIRYSVPLGTDPEDVRVHGSFANLGGQVYWILREHP